MKGFASMRSLGLALAAVCLTAPWALAAAPPPEGAGKPGALTPEQRQKMKVIRDDHRKAIEPLRKDLKLKVDELRLLLDKEAADAQLSAKLDEIKKVQKTIQELVERFRADEAAVLTIRQRAEIAIRMADRAWKDSRPGRGMRGMRRERMEPGAGPHGQGGPGKPAAPGAEHEDDD